MSHVNRTNTRADHFKVTDTETLSNGAPFIYKGRLIKTVELFTTSCPECEDEDGEAVEAWVDINGDEICPECGMVCSGPNNPSMHPEDSTWASRGGYEGTGTPALLASPIPLDTNGATDYGNSTY